ncbi:MAG: hypothetical protein JF615_16260, partial [Asticcacaulis sp.]|nr:hypothetical protein [Asticcacaulis sp.]
MWLFGLYCLVLLTLLPYVAGFAIIEHLHGWLRVGAIVLALAACIFIPFWLTGPAIHRANQHSPDAGGYLAIGAMLMIVPLLIEVVAGMIVAAVQARKQRVTES